MAALRQLIHRKLGKGGAYPSKRTINLLENEHKTGETIFTLSLFLIFLVFLFGFSRLFVADQLQRADEAENRYQQVEQSLNKIKEANQVYDDVESRYSHYGKGYLNDQERAEADRLTMLDVIEEKVHPSGGIRSITITDNTAELSVEISQADRMPEIIADLESSPYVNYATATTEGTVDQNDGALSYVETDITIIFRSPQEMAAIQAQGAATGNAQAQGNAAGDVQTQNDTAGNIEAESDAAGDMQSQNTDTGNTEAGAGASEASEDAGNAWEESEEVMSSAES
ncbi:MAG: hypothetical protein PUA70_02265 [Oribacterium sp.]|nr:hypothetical protein [Oribacterium sp.]